MTFETFKTDIAPIVATLLSHGHNLSACVLVDSALHAIAQEDLEHAHATCEYVIAQSLPGGPLHGCREWFEGPGGDKLAQYALGLLSALSASAVSVEAR